MQIMLQCYDELLFIEELLYVIRITHFSCNQFPLQFKQTFSELFCIKPTKEKNHSALENTHSGNLNRPWFPLNAYYGRKGYPIAMSRHLAGIWKADFPIHCFAGPSQSNYCSVKQHFAFGPRVKANKLQTIMGLLFPWATPVKTRTHFVPYHGQHLFHGHNKFFIFPASFCALFVQDKANGQKEKQKEGENRRKKER